MTRAQQTFFFYVSCQKESFGCFIRITNSVAVVVVVVVVIIVIVVVVIIAVVVVVVVVVVVAVVVVAVIVVAVAVIVVAVAVIIVFKCCSAPITLRQQQLEWFNAHQQFFHLFEPQDDTARGGRS